MELIHNQKFLNVVFVVRLNHMQHDGVFLEGPGTHNNRTVIKNSTENR